MKLKFCRYPECGLSNQVARLRRELCQKHYKQARKLVKLKKTTWIKLVKAGKCGPDSRYTHDDSWFLEKK